MAKVCERCGRGPQVGKSRSHSMIGTKRRFNLNLQTQTVDGRRMRICTACLKTMRKTTRS